MSLDPVFFQFPSDALTYILVSDQRLSGDRLAALCERQRERVENTRSQSEVASENLFFPCDLQGSKHDHLGLYFILSHMNVAEITSTPIGGYAPDFELPGVDQSVHHLSRYLEKYRAVGVIFISNTCPYVERYLKRIKQIQRNFSDRGLILIGINANHTLQNPAETLEQMKDFSQAKDLNFPYLRDVTQDVAQCFGATKTPEVFLLDKNGVICYKGQIDDAPEDETAVQKSYLQDAIAKLLNQEAIAQVTTPPIGCEILWH